MKINDRYTYIVYEHNGEYWIEQITQRYNDTQFIHIAQTAKEALSKIIDICEKEGEQ